MFPASPLVRADLRPGTLYAVSGETGWVYYGQITADKSVGFLRRRDRAIAAADEVLASPVMGVVSVSHPSITRALRSGCWAKVGRFPLVGGLDQPRPVVQWAVGTLEVTVWIGGAAVRDTRVDDTAIQDLERMAVWDAEDHIPQRLTVDFGAEPGAWHVGGPIGRERRVQEEMAGRSPEAAHHRLPADWVPTGAG